MSDKFSISRRRLLQSGAALGGAMLPLHANFAPDHDVFLKAA